MLQTKYSEEEIYGKHFFELISIKHKEKLIQQFQKVITEKNKTEVVLEIVPKFGAEQLFSFVLYPVFENNNLEGIIGTGKNIDKENIYKKTIEELKSKLTEANRLNAIERDRAQQQINILSELNTLKNEFISNVSHELRTPLSSIIGFSETIDEDKNLTAEKAKEFNEIILTESKRLAKLINDVLDFSELENEKKQLKKNSVDIIKILSRSIENIKEKCSEKKITITDKLPEAEVIIFADENRIKKAIDYLLNNAVKFTNENGRITVMVKEFLKEIEIIISDTGIGIPKENLPFLFDKFSKINKKGHKLPGAGFGLITVKQIIDLHKGLINVKSEINKGTSFIIKLPKYKFE